MFLNSLPGKSSECTGRGGLQRRLCFSSGLHARASARRFLLPKSASLRTVHTVTDQERWLLLMGFQAVGRCSVGFSRWQRVAVVLCTIFLLGLLSGLLFGRPAIAQTKTNGAKTNGAKTNGAEKVDCGATTSRTLVELKDASAGLFANFRGAESSIKYQSGAILKRALEIRKDLKAEHLSCPKMCGLATDSSIEFVARPRQFNKEHPENEKCQQYFTQTTALPLTWLRAPFGDFDEFSRRFSDFSQGSGAAGEELYRKCDGACSPQYRILISQVPSETGYIADVYVVCGLPRDKDDNMYTLETSLVWPCVPQAPG